MYRRIAGLAIATISTAAALVAGQPSLAEAATSGTINRTVNTSYFWTAKDVGACMVVNVKGKLSARWWVTKLSMGGKRWNIEDPKLVNPKVTVYSYTACDRKKRKAVTGVTFTQIYYNAACGFHVGGLTVSVSGGGLSAGLAFTYRCDDQVVGKRHSNFRKDRGSKWTQSNSGTTVVWKKRVHATSRTGVEACIQPQVNLNVYKGSAADGRNLTVLEQCLTIPPQ
ncbi:MAG TPA: hypothetical protein PKE46_02690 [Micropruina sp.]|nr:hypothetical protein [Micropruina sp.]